MIVKNTVQCSRAGLRASEMSTLTIRSHSVMQFIIMQFILSKAIFYDNKLNLTTLDRLSLTVDLLHQMKYFQCEGPMPNTLKY